MVSSFQRRKRESKRAASVLPGSHHPTSQVAYSAPVMQPRDNKRDRLLPSAMLGTMDNDLLIRCASYLDADGLAQLGRMSARFGIPQAGLRRSLANEAARQLFCQCATDEERGCLPKNDDESNIGLYRALELLRQPLHFDQLAGDGFGPQENPARVTYTGRRFSTAMSGHAMRGGRHFVEFAITNGERNSNFAHLGVIRPVSLSNGIDLDNDREGHVPPLTVLSSYYPAVSENLRSQITAKWRDSNVHCCAYYCFNGRCCSTDWDNEMGDTEWLGCERVIGSGTVGLLLDLNEGTLSVFKNGRRLGVMKEGLGGEYVWFFSVFSASTISMSKCRAPN